jgi:CubicO group peptidase (beta-lactamase class C family)
LHRRNLLPLPFAALTLRGSRAFAQQPTVTRVWPGLLWDRIGPDQAGWSRDKLAQAHDFARNIGTASLVVVQHGRIVDCWGDITSKFELHSMRKSLLNSLIGIAVAADKINLDATIGSLGIDDVAPSLSVSEKQATIRDLLESRSGVYHPALYETEGEKRRRPPRGSHPPGTFWYYNNWDFNVLGTIYERAVNESIFGSFQEHIANPLGMQDYRPQDGQYIRGATSRYPAYLFSMNALDLARFGLLYLRSGLWQNRSIVPAAWVKASTTSWSEVSSRFGIGYGYLWWVPDQPVNLMNLSSGGFWADGYRGQFILVDPVNDLVVVHQTGSGFVDDRQMGYLMGQLLAAAPPKSG